MSRLRPAWVAAEAQEQGPGSGSGTQGSFQSAGVVAPTEGRASALGPGCLRSPGEGALSQPGARSALRIASMATVWAQAPRECSTDGAQGQWVRRAPALQPQTGTLRSADVMAWAGLGLGPSRETGLVSVTILCPSCGERPARGCTQAGEQTLTTESLGKGRKGPGVGRTRPPERAGDARTCGAESRFHRRPRPDSWAPPGGRGEKKPAETADTVTLCKHLEGSVDPAQLLFTAFGENGSYVLCLQFGRRGDTAAALLRAASFLPIMKGGKTEATRDSL